VSEKEQDGTSPKPLTGSAGSQAEQGATGQEPLKAAPTDKEWLKAMESIRSDAPPVHMRVGRRSYRPRAEER
jgi:hypothetical protein